ncbi:MAG: hypothetical protein Q8S41_10295, partial [Lutibacter sp.]|nr:hypothetical protein [Lutibacter sp.]
MESKTTQLKDFFNNFSGKFYSKRTGNFVTLFLTICLTLAMSFSGWGQASITTDNVDYQPGETVQITCAGFLPGESVQLLVVHTKYQLGDPIGEGHEPWFINADTNGNISTTWFVALDDHLGELLRVSAIGQTSGENVWHEFTDATITSTATGGNWNATTTWFGGIIPATTDDVVIAVGATVTVTDNRTVKSVALAGGSSNTKLQINSGITLTVTGDVSLNGPGVNNFTNELAVGSGILNVGGNLIVGGGGGSNRNGILSITTGAVTVTGNVSLTSNSNAQINFSSSGILKIAGTFTLGNGTFTPSIGTIEYNGNDQAIESTSYYNLETSGSGTKTMKTAITTTNSFTIGLGTTVDASSYTTTISGGASLNINGTLDFTNSSGIFRTGTSGTSTLVMGSNGLLRTFDQDGIGPVNNSSLQVQGSGSWLTSSISTNGTIEYYRNTSGQTVTNRVYNNLIIRNVETKSFSGITTINGNFSINSPAVVNLGTFTSTANSLSLSGVGQVNGSWGSSSAFCPAINKNSTYFGTTAAGILNVTTNTTPCTPPAITSQPVNSSITYGANTNFTVVASNATGYQWEVSTNGGGTWNPITNGGVYTTVTTAVLNITKPTVSMSGYQYRCVVTGACNPVATSNGASLTINAKAITGNFTVDATKVYDGGTLSNVLTRTLNGVISP